jgi:type I restriction enzyme R subunit
MNERFSNGDYRKFINITQLMIFSNNSEYDDSEFVPLEGAFYATTAYTTKPNKNKFKDEVDEEEKPVKLFFNRFREEETEIFNRISPINESTEIEILRDTNYLLIKATPEYETNKNPLSPTNRILTSLLSADRFLFILELSNERQVNQAI